MSKNPPIFLYINLSFSRSLLPVHTSISSSLHHLCIVMAALGRAVTYLEAKRGGRHLKDDDGYLYYKTRKVVEKDRVYWACLDRITETCTSTAITQLSTGNLLSNKLHNHGNNLLKVSAKEVERSKVDMAATMPTVAPRVVLGKNFV